MALAVFIPDGDSCLNRIPGVHAEILNAPGFHIPEYLAGAAGVEEDGVVVLGDVVEHQPGGSDGADLLHLGDVGVQSDAADDGIVDEGFKNNIRLVGADMGQGIRDVADGGDENPAGIGRVQKLPVQGVAVDGRGLGGGVDEAAVHQKVAGGENGGGGHQVLRLRRRGGRRLRGGGHRGLRLGQQGIPGDAAQQEEPAHAQGNHQHHRQRNPQRGQAPAASGRLPQKPPPALMMLLH